MPEPSCRDLNYRVRVAALGVGLVAYAVGYVAVVLVAVRTAVTHAAAVGATWESLTGRNDSWFQFLDLAYGAVIGTALAATACYLVASLARQHRWDSRGTVALGPADYPELFDFVGRVAAATGCRPPRHVYAGGDAVTNLTYNASLVNVFAPPPLDLVLGLGLVNLATLGEFEALLAQEFARFAPRVVGLGARLEIALVAVTTIANGPAPLHRFVNGWRLLDSRLGRRIRLPVSWPAHLIALSMDLALGFQYVCLWPLFMLEAALSRRRVTLADDEAVRVAGRDALIRGFAILESAHESLGDVSDALSAAAWLGVQTDDLFSHQLRTVEHLAREAEERRLALLTELPTPAAFEAPPGFWSLTSPPTRAEREAHARRRAGGDSPDVRPAWSLFRDATSLRLRLTAEFYGYVLSCPEPFEPQPAERVQGLLDAERAAVAFPPRFTGWYVGRHHDAGDLSDLPYEPWPPERLTLWLATWPAGELGRLRDAYSRHLGEWDFLHVHPARSGRGFRFRGEDRRAADLKPVIEQVKRECDENGKAQTALDRTALLAHWSAARRLDAAAPRAGQSRTAELLERHGFHAAIQKLHWRLDAHQGWADDYRDVRGRTGYLRPVRNDAGFIVVCQTVIDATEGARALTPPLLPGERPDTSAHGLIAGPRPVRLEVPTWGVNHTVPEWLTHFDRASSGVRRLHYESLAAIVRLHDEIAAEWAAVTPPGAAPQTSAPCGA